MLEEIAITKIADMVFEKYRKMKEENKEKITTVKFESESFTRSFIDDATTTDTEFNSDSPNITFENPYSNSDCILRELSIIPDDAFKAKGKVSIAVNDRVIFETVKFGNLKNVLESLHVYRGGVPIPKHKEKSIQIFLASEDATPVNLTVSVMFGAA